MIKIPAIDIIHGKVVRLTKGDFDKQRTYDVDLFELIDEYEKAGAKNLHIVDLDGARGLPHNRELIKKVVKRSSLKVQLGGGIRTEDVLCECLDMGVSSCIIGSTAVTDFDLVSGWLSKYDTEKIIIGADVKDRKIASEGWKVTNSVDIFDFIKQYRLAGADVFLCTDVSVDGTLSGVAIDLYKNIMEKSEGVKIIASGGVSSLTDLKDLESAGLYATVIGKALLENRFQAKDMFIC